MNSEEAFEFKKEYRNKIHSMLLPEGKKEESENWN